MSVPEVPAFIRSSESELVAIGNLEIAFAAVLFISAFLLLVYTARRNYSSNGVPRRKAVR